MKIGIDARLYNSAGIGRYISNLIYELELQDKTNEYVVFVNKESDKIYHPINKNFKKWIVDVRPYTYREQSYFLFEILKANLDLFHATNFNFPVFYPRPFVITIHDLIMLKLDNQSTVLKSKSKYYIKNYIAKFVFKYGLKKSKRIIVPTKSIKKKIVDSYGENISGKVDVIYEGFDERLKKNLSSDKSVIKTHLTGMNIRGNYLLYVGSSYPHKNLRTLIVSFKSLIDNRHYNGQLVIAGKITKFAKQLAGFVHALKLDSKILFASQHVEKGILTDIHLGYLYTGATAYIMPSIEEGFSLTPLEAQSFGVPVILSDIDVHREIYGNSALYFNPKSNLDLSENLVSILNNAKLNERLVREGYDNVKRYSFKLMAQQILNVYNKDI